MSEDYLKSQIMTYMGNKRKFLPKISEILNSIKMELGKKELNIGEGFSGTGIVSRLFKVYSKNLFVNDIAGYSETLNKCYLANMTPNMYNRINILIKQINTLVDKEKGVNYSPWISKHWAPKDDKNIKEGERVYFTEKNGKRIDMYRYLINQISEDIRPFFWDHY